MAFAVTQLPDDPILIVNLAAPLQNHLASIRSVNAQIARIIATTENTLYVVIDGQDIELAFSDILIGISQLEAQPIIWTTDARAQIVIVGTNPMLDIGAKRLKQRLGVKVERYPSLETALNAIRARLTPRT
jgi:hypothetical protein